MCQSKRNGIGALDLMTSDCIHMLITSLNMLEETLLHAISNENKQIHQQSWRFILN